jgi:hypothetical protein
LQDGLDGDYYHLGGASSVNHEGKRDNDRGEEDSARKAGKTKQNRQYQLPSRHSVVISEELVCIPPSPIGMDAHHSAPTAILVPPPVGGSAVTLQFNFFIGK